MSQRKHVVATRTGTAELDDRDEAFYEALGSIEMVLESILAVLEEIRDQKPGSRRDQTAGRPT